MRGTAGYFVLVNLTVLIMFGIDKRQACKGGSRMPERVLLLAALLGGAIGAWMGMYVFRHKTRRMKFVIGVPVIMMSYIGLFVYWEIKF